MKTLSTGIFIFMFALAAQAESGNNNQNNAAALGQFSESLRELSSRVSPSVVQVVGTGFGLQNDPQHAGVSVLSKQRSMGSGVIVSEDGYIVTNAHVVEGARNIRVKLNDFHKGRVPLFDAKLVGTDSQIDLALLKINSTGLTPLPFGNSMDLKQGELVLAFGSPLGMDNSVSMGVVSAVARQFSDDDAQIYVQTDAPINPGNSGGPLVDASGSLVGINTFIFSKSGGSEGMGFAIPSNVVRYVYASLRKDGHVHRGQIGIRARTITEPLASAFGIEPQNGVLVEDVTPESPAEDGGLQIGDVVSSIDGTDLRNVRDLALQLYQYAIGDTVNLQILRNQTRSGVSVTVTEKPDEQERFADVVNPAENLIAQLGVLGITVDDRIRWIVPLRVPEGVLVAAHSGVSIYFGDQPKEGDVIHAVNGERISSVEALRLKLNGLKSTDPVVFQVERNGSLMFLVLENN
jgi:serine protease Do